MQEVNKYRQLISSFILPLLICIFISGVVAYQVKISNEEFIKKEINQDLQLLTFEVKKRIELFQYGLRGVRGAILTAGEANLSRDIFHSYSLTRDYSTEFPGAHGFGFIRKVPLEDENDFLTKARLDGKPDFKIRQLTPHSDDRYVIQYIEPVEQNASAIGLDVASEINRKEAADASMLTGKVVISSPITLVQANKSTKQAFLLYLPIYKTIVTPETQTERKNQLIGWSYAPLLMSEVLQNLSLDKQFGEVNIYDVTNNLQQKFFSSKATSQIFESQVISEMSIFGKQWKIEFSVNKSYIQKFNLVKYQEILFIGFLLSILVASLIRILFLFNERKRISFDENSRIAAIVTNSSDAIIGKDLNGVVTSWNSGAEKIFGYSSEEAIGKTLFSLVIPKELIEEEWKILTSIRNGEVIPNFTTKRHKKDGSTIAASIAVSPIRNSKGIVIGASKTVRDISEQQAIQERILELNQNLEAKVAIRTEQLELAKTNLQKILDAVPTMIGYWDKNYINRIANKAYEDWFGVDYLTIPGMHAKELLGEKLFEKNIKEMNAALSGKRQEFIRAIPTPNGVKHSSIVYLPDVYKGEVCGFYVIIHDVSEITKTNYLLKKALSENQAILNTIDQQLLYSVSDVKGTILEVNKNYSVVTGYRSEELVGRNHRLFNSGMHSKEFWNDMWNSIANGNTWRADVCNKNKEGELQWFDTVISPLTSDDGKIDRYVSLSVDISERKLNETAISKLNVFITSVLNAATEISIIATDNNGLITVFNRGAQRMLGYEAEEVINKMSPAPFHLVDEVVGRGQELSKEYQEEISGFRVFVHKSELEGSEIRQWTYVRKDGTQLKVSLMVTAMRDDLGNITGYLGVATNITDELNAKKEMQSLIEQLDIASKIAELGIWTWHISDNSLEWSDRMFDIYEQPKSLRDNGLNYQHWYERVHPDDVEKTAALLNAAVEGSAVYNPIFRIVTPKGDIKYIQGRAQVERDEKGNAIKVTGINRDISIQKNLETVLRNAKEAADASSASKSAFLANMSHEIRTPMNAVLGMLKLLQYTSLDERQKDYLSKSQGAAKSLLGLLNDILDFSKIDAGKLQLDSHSFELEPLLRDLAVILSVNQGAKRVEVLFDIDPALPKFIFADRLRLQQILINLSSNALKFTQQGQVLVSIQLVERTFNTITIEITVSDTGIGISPEHLDKIFEGFEQAESSTTRRFGGSGLGLVITKRLVELMGGELKLESQVGVGSKFWFDIILVTPDRENRTILEESNIFSGKRILVVDDVAMSREVLIRPLQALGAYVSEAGTGFEAIEKIREAELKNELYDVVLMDWNMPDVDGLQASKEIKQISSKQDLPVIIMVTAYGREEVFAKQNPRLSPYTDLLTKPVTPLQVIESIVKSLKGETSIFKDINSVETRQQLLNGLHLLVVEDNALNRQVAFELLSGEGAIVELAECGLDGVAKVLSGDQKYDLVIMDIQMPDIDGMEATRRIRAIPNFKDLPILAMTANASSEDKNACIQSGMNDHVAKPIDMDEVVPRILTLINNPSARLLQNEVVNLEGDVNKLPSIENMQAILRRFSDSKDLYQRMLGNFPQDAMKLLTTISLQNEEGNFKAVASTLHALKGVASLMGAKAVSLKCSGLEKIMLSKEIAEENKKLSAQSLHELSHLLNNSVAKLEQSFKEVLSVKESDLDIRPDVIFTSEDWEREFESITPLLVADNLLAIEKLEELFGKLSNFDKKQLEKILSYANTLQFSLAIEAINNLLKKV